MSYLSWISEFQLDYDDSEFFENVLRNLNGRTKKEMSMLGQVCWLGLTNCEILMIFWCRVSTDPYGLQPPLWSMLTIQGTGIRSVRRILFISIYFHPATVWLYFSKGGLQSRGNLQIFFVALLLFTLSYLFFFFFWKKLLKFYIHHHLLYERSLNVYFVPSPPTSPQFPKHWWYVLMIFLFCVPGWNSSTSILPQGKPSNVLELKYPQQKFPEEDVRFFFVKTEDHYFQKKTYWRFLSNS